MLKIMWLPLFKTSHFDVILIFKSWFKPHISYKSVELHGYNTLRNDHTGRGGGGVAAYVKSHIFLSVLYCSDNSRIE